MRQSDLEKRRNIERKKGSKKQRKKDVKSKNSHIVTCTTAKEMYDTLKQINQQDTSQQK
jgi:hypothetical protein